MAAAIGTDYLDESYLLRYRRNLNAKTANMNREKLRAVLRAAESKIEFYHVWFIQPPAETCGPILPAEYSLKVFQSLIGCGSFTVKSAKNPALSLEELAALRIIAKRSKGSKIHVRICFDFHLTGPAFCIQFAEREKILPKMTLCEQKIALLPVHVLV